MKRLSVRIVIKTTLLMNLDEMQNWAGWLPAIILPFSTSLQLWRIVRERHSEGVSAPAWGLFAVANFGAYLFTGQYSSIQAILAFLLSAFLDLCIVVFLLFPALLGIKPNASATSS